MTELIPGKQLKILCLSITDNSEPGIGGIGFTEIQHHRLHHKSFPRACQAVVPLHPEYKTINARFFSISIFSIVTAIAGMAERNAVQHWLKCSDEIAI